MNTTAKNKTNSAAHLLHELETLKQVLDGQASSRVSHNREIPVLEPLDDIPLLNEFFDDIPVLRAVTGNVPAQKAATPITATAPTLTQIKASASASAPIAAKAATPAVAQSPAPVATPAPQAEQRTPAITGLPTEAPLAAPKTSAIAMPKRSENPFLPQSMLDRLNHERTAAQQSADEAHRTMLRITEQKHQDARSALLNIGKELNPEQKDAVIDQMVNEMLPQIADRLREKLRLMLNR